MEEKKKPTRKRKWLWIFLSIIFALVAYSAYFYLTLPDVSYLEKENPKTTAIIEQRKSEAKSEGRKLKIRQQWVGYGAIPKLLKNAVLISEDAAFYEHEGIDYFELKESIKRNLKEGKPARGGSTITQQLAKNLFLSTNKSYLRKLKEFFIAKRLEKHLSKDRILHLYLNIIEFGKGIFGVGAASQYYFGKPVSNLNLSEIIRLVSVIPKPLKVTPTSNSPYLKWRARLLLVRMIGHRYITESQYDSIKAEFKK